MAVQVSQIIDTARFWLRLVGESGPLPQENSGIVAEPCNSINVQNLLGLEFMAI